MSKHWLSWSVLLALLSAPGARADEPQVAFRVKGKWLSFVVTQAGQPVPDVGVQVFSANGQSFAQGETDADGRGSFPVPPGAYCTLEMRVGTQVADTIKLTTTADTVMPAAVLLSFGLKPCCRIPTRGSLWATAPVATTTAPAPAGALPLEVRVLLSVAFLVVGTALVGVAGRQYWLTRSRARMQHV